MQFLEDFILQNENKITTWLEAKMKGKSLPLYSSCDVRYAGFKITQVDANCFPAGFNNLGDEAIFDAIRIYEDFFKKNNIKKVLVYPEFHTRNIGYLENLLTLDVIFEEAGVEVKFATNQEEDFQTKFITLRGKKRCICYKAIKREGNSIVLKNSNFIPDLVILNNDLTSGVPEILKNLNIDVLPLIKMGWHTRLKSNHFKEYSKVVNDFAKDFNLDPWMLDSYFDDIVNFDFKNNSNHLLLEEKVTNLYNKIAVKYKEYGIQKTPTIFIKSNRGTYGMGIHVVHNLDEMRHFNKDVRKKMDVIRDGVKNSDLIIQEGVETIFTQNEKAVEPVVYSALARPVGMFFRINDGNLANLNAKGMRFSNSYNIGEEQRSLANLISSLSNVAIGNEVSGII
jgi:glutamate--cysteine ligase